jgi:peroxiredoxin
MEDRHDDRSSHDATPGTKAPAFAAPASTGKTLSLDDFLGKVPVALTFAGTLPDNDVDTLIAAFNEHFAEFGRHLVQALIVTPEDRSTVRQRRREGTNVPLLADDDGALLDRYAASATFPATVVIDTDGTVTRLVEGGRPEAHASAIVGLAKARASSRR